MYYSDPYCVPLDPRPHPETFDLGREHMTLTVRLDGLAEG